jgi:adenylate cyclase
MTKRIKSLTTIDPFTITLCLTLPVIVVFLIAPSFLEMVELKTLYLKFKSRGALEGTDAVALVAIDEESIDAEGRWPWPRSKIADLVDYLSDDGAKVIGFDIGFLKLCKGAREKTARKDL